MKNTKIFRRQQSGFTLVEIMLVITVMGIVAAIAVPAIREWLPNYRLKKAAWDVYSTLHQVRLEAVQEHEDRTILFIPGNNSYRMVTDEGPNDDWVAGTDVDPNPGKDGDYGTADDNIPEKPAVILLRFGSAVQYGHPDGCSGACPSPDGAGFDDDITFTDNMITFDSEGMITTSSGYVYLRNNIGSCYAIGALTSGAIFMRRWYQGTENWG